MKAQDPPKTEPASPPAETARPRRMRRRLTPAALEARRRNARKSTGPRTPEGKRRAALNSLRHGLYLQDPTLLEAMPLLDENPWRCARLRDGLMAALAPADDLERMLVEDVALVQWKLAHLERIETSVQARRVGKLESERRRRLLEVNQLNLPASQEEILREGLLNLPDSPGKFDSLFEFLDAALECVRKQKFPPYLLNFLRAVFGERATLRGAQAFNLALEFSKLPPGTPPDPELLAGLEAALHAKIRNVADQYEFYLREHVDLTAVERAAASAMEPALWSVMIRQENSLHRRLERRLALLAQFQQQRRARESVKADSPGRDKGRPPRTR